MEGDAPNLNELAAAAGGRSGVVWKLEASGDLNANLVRFDAGGGVGEHVNQELDVVFVGVAGSGLVRVEAEEHPLGRWCSCLEEPDARPSPSPMASPTSRSTGGGGRSRSAVEADEAAYLPGGRVDKG